MVVNLLHVLPYQGLRLDSVDVTSGRLQLSSHIYVYEGKSFYLLNTVWRPVGCTLNTGFISNSEERSDGLLRCTDGCKLEHFKSSRDGRPDTCMGFFDLESAQNLLRTT
jgi:hypothetical protein